MSADNGLYVEKKAEDKFSVYMYWASVDYASTDDMTWLSDFTTLEDAMNFANNPDNWTEYGVQYMDSTIKIEEQIEQQALTEVLENSNNDIYDIPEEYKRKIVGLVVEQRLPLLVATFLIGKELGKKER